MYWEDSFAADFRGSHFQDANSLGEEMLQMAGVLPAEAT